MNDSRIRAVERWVKENRTEPLRVLATMPGETDPAWMTVDDMVSSGAEWAFRTTGNNVKDVSKVIEYITPGCVIH